MKWMDVDLIEPFLGHLMDFIQGRQPWTFQIGPVTPGCSLAQANTHRSSVAPKVLLMALQALGVWSTMVTHWFFSGLHRVHSPPVVWFVETDSALCTLGVARLSA